MSEETQGTTTPPEATEAGGKIMPFQRLFPPQPLIWQEAHRLASLKNVRVEDLALCASQDPVLVVELLRVANGISMAGTRAPLTTTTTCIMRLGSELVIETLDQLADRPRITDIDLLKLFEMHRFRCKRAAILARMLAEVVSKSVSDECHTLGGLLFIGEMLAVLHFGPIYGRLYANSSLSSVNYKLSQEHKFDVERMGIVYLERQGIPELLTSAINRDGRIRSPERAIIKPICFASAEMIDAFDSSRWEKLAPGRQLPPKSSLRMLGMNDQQYLRLYERATEYLYVEKLAYEKRAISDLCVDPRAVKPKAVESPPPRKEINITPPPSQPTAAEFSLEAEILELMATAEEEEQVAPPPLPPTAKRTVEPPNLRKHTPPPPSDQFSLSGMSNKEKSKPRETPRPVVPPPQLRTKAGQDFVMNVTGQLDRAKTSEELLREILGVLTETGPFEKSALIVVAKDRKTALVVAARGPSIDCGQTLILEDPLSPLAQCFSKVQSFGNKSSSESPWGSKAFALSPIDADHETPVALYADCGIEGSLTFEARRIFRAVVDILNQKLPTIPGGIPVEI